MDYFCVKIYSLTKFEEILLLWGDGMTKSEIRGTYKARRKDMGKERIMALSNRATEYFLVSDVYRRADTIMLYMPVCNEADTSVMMKKALCDGKRVVLPVTSAAGIITPVYVDGNTAYNKGTFSIPEPTGGKTASADDIDVIIVPGIAFDKEGSRVGYGKGCYDRFLPISKAVKIGYCFNDFICDRIHTDSTDIPVDFLLTESGLTRCR